MLGQWGTVEEVDAGSCRVLMAADNLDWPTLALGAVRAEFEIVGPPELAEQVREWSTRFARATATP